MSAASRGDSVRRLQAARPKPQVAQLDLRPVPTRRPGRVSPRCPPARARPAPVTSALRSRESSLRWARPDTVRGAKAAGLAVVAQRRDLEVGCGAGQVPRDIQVRRQTLRMPGRRWAKSSAASRTVRRADGSGRRSPSSPASAIAGGPAACRGIGSPPSLSTIKPVSPRPMRVSWARAKDAGLGRRRASLASLPARAMSIGPSLAQQARARQGRLLDEPCRVRSSPKVEGFTASRVSSTGSCDRDTRLGGNAVHIRDGKPPVDHFARPPRRIQRVCRQSGRSHRSSSMVTPFKRDVRVAEIATSRRSARVRAGRRPQGRLSLAGQVCGRAGQRLFGPSRRTKRRGLGSSGRQTRTLGFLRCRIGSESETFAAGDSDRLLGEILWGRPRPARSSAVSPLCGHAVFLTGGEAELAVLPRRR